MTRTWHFEGLDALRAGLETRLGEARLHHALLLTGPAGVGKRSIAAWIARALLCREPLGCGSCGSCHRVETGEHLDLLRVERPQGRMKIPVEAVRRLVDQLERGAAEGRGRVAILVDAELMSVEGQNSLLKALEEPAAGRTLILSSARPESLLETVRSRCEAIRVPPLDRETLAGLLGARGVDEGRIPRLVVLADGSLGQALELHEQGVEAWEELLTPLLQGSEELSPPAWARLVLEGVDSAAEGVREAKRGRAQRTLGLALRLLRHGGRGGEPETWDGVEVLLDAQRDLGAGLGAELVLQSAYRHLGELRGARLR